MIHYLRAGLLAAIVCIGITSCKKDAGPGGLATIKGRVFATDVTTSGNIKDSGYIGNQRVFISVSGNTVQFDDVKTSYDGSYEFKFLRKGQYDVWAYSDCDTCVWAQQKVILTGIDISDKKQTVVAPDLRIIF
ncbi:MAG: DUF3823 domain-containing protein [Sphingobacteriales bacterium]|nr:MAG: DUF3823 domain-containing protein [Sphingobacteriales bacterium]